jgi:hypothetical protein
MGEISYAVPAATTSLFLVVTDGPPAPASLSLPDGPGLTTVTWDAGSSPFDLARVLSDDCPARPLPSPSAFHTLVCASAQVRHLPRPAQVARAYARRLAVTGRGLLIDWLTGDLVLAPERAERDRFHLGDQWLGFDAHVYEERHRAIPPASSWPAAPPPEDACGALRFRTRGLTRFGLPELVIDGVDCDHRLTAVNVLRAVGQHLLAGHWRWLAAGTPAPPATMPQTLTGRTASVQTVAGAAFGAYWGSSLPGAQPLTVGLTHGRGTLRVAAPGGGLLNTWLAEQRDFLGSLAACPPDDFHSYAELPAPA